VFVNFEMVQKNFREWKGDLESKWCELSDDDWKEVDANKEKLIWKIQEKYGRSREDARREVDDFWIEQVIRNQIGRVA